VFQVFSYSHDPYNSLCLLITKSTLTAVAERIKSLDAVRQRIEGCKDELKTVIEPNYGLVEELLSCGALSSDEREEVRAAKTRSKRCSKLLKCILKRSENDACCTLLDALDRTDQHHVVNFILNDSGSTYPSTVNSAVAILL